MITRRLLSLSLILSAVSLVGAEATSQVARHDLEFRPAAETRSPVERMHSLIFAAIDFDRDGVLSAAEMTNASMALRALDLNDDGLLAVDELRRVQLSQPTAARGPRTGSVSPGFILAFTLDANHDGLIQTMEMANAATSLKALDINGDGQLTLGELRPATVASQS
jgi:Ca2+-binding EF-hand superfamily protein